MRENPVKELIVNADDFGLTDGVTRGILEAHERGVVTSTTLMVRMPAAERAVEAARRFPSLGIGLHVDLGEWAYRDGAWNALYDVVDLDDPAAVAAEVVAQVERFENLTGRLPSHLDSHQHVHRDGPAGAAVTAMADRLRCPLRGRDVPYVGAFYGQLGTGEPYPEAITVEAFAGLVADAGPGTTEIGCHPGHADGLAETGTMYVGERERELAVLCDERLRQVLDEHGAQLRSFDGLTTVARS